MGQRHFIAGYLCWSKISLMTVVVDALLLARCRGTLYVIDNSGKKVAISLFDMGDTPKLRINL